MLAEAGTLMRRFAQAPPELTFIYSDYIRGTCRTNLGSWSTCTPYAVPCYAEVIGKIEKNGQFRAGVKLICLQIAICNRACGEDKYSNDNGLS